MKKGFTIVEVSILFVIFLIVAFLVAPLSLDDTIKAKNTSRWRSVQSDFANIFYSINTQKDDDFVFNKAFTTVMSGEISKEIEPYKITYLNGTFPGNTYRFPNFYITQGNSVVSYKFFDEPQGDLMGILMYDVNGPQNPNVWGRDVFGLNIYSDRFEPFCKNDSLSSQKEDCSKNGSGLCCSNYYLVGGSIE